MNKKLYPELRKKYYLNNIFCDDYSNLPKLRFEGFEEKFSNNNLNEICKITKGDQINNENLTNNGKYYYLNGGLKLSGWTDNFNRLGNTISISEGGESCGFVNYNQRNFWSGGHLYTLDNLEDKIDTYFLFSVLKYKQKSIMRLRVGTGLPNIQKPSLSKINIVYPKLKEQTKIAKFFTLLDKQIQLIERKLELYELRKKYYLNNIFCDDYSNLPKLRFEGFEDIWKEKKIFDLLKYEQPTKYIVDFAKYNYNKSKIPVLTANKGFILGYTDEINNIYNKGNSIIFDDFTTDFKYVDFKYKIKSSAIKILTTKNDDSLYFIFNLWQKKRFIPIGHNRHYISIIQEIFFSLPSLEEQTKIANLFSSLDESIQNLKKQKDQLTKRKTYYLNNMFV